MTIELTRRTPEAEKHFNMQPFDVAFFHPSRLPVIMRSGSKHVGISLEYSHSGGRNWQYVSFHESVAKAIDKFAEIRTGIGGKDREPTHYRILCESL